MLDVLAALCLLADALNGPPTDARRAVALTALDIANQRVRSCLFVSYLFECCCVVFCGR